MNAHLLPLSLGFSPSRRPRRMQCLMKGSDGTEAHSCFPLLCERTEVAILDCHFWFYPTLSNMWRHPIFLGPPTLLLQCIESIIYNHVFSFLSLGQSFWEEGGGVWCITVAVAWETSTECRKLSLIIIFNLHNSPFKRGINDYAHSAKKRK